jgi:hypothetical protein
MRGVRANGDRNPDVGLVGDVHVNIGIATTIPRTIEAGVLLSSDGAAGEPRSGSPVLTPSPFSPQCLQTQS